MFKRFATIAIVLSVCLCLALLIVPSPGIQQASAASYAEPITELAIGDTWSITYKDYNGNDLAVSLPATYPTSYVEGMGETLPTVAPPGWMPDYDFLGFWDCPLDPSQTVPIMGTFPAREGLNFQIGNQITVISSTATGPITLYLRCTSNAVDVDIAGNENYLYAPPGVFPNGTTANILAWAPSTTEYQSLLLELDGLQPAMVKFVEFSVMGSTQNQIQPLPFFGDAVVGFKVPDGFSKNDLALFRIVFSGSNVELISSMWTDPSTGEYFIEGRTDHFSPYALLDLATPEIPSAEIPSTNDISSAGIVLALTLFLGGVLLILPGILALSTKRQRCSIQ